MRGQFYKEMSDFVNSKKLKIQNKNGVAEQIGCKIAEEMNNERYSFHHWKKSSPGWVGVKAVLRIAYSNQKLWKTVFNIFGSED